MEEKLNLEQAKCDKYDYLIATSCGVLSGVVDIFFVGAPGQSVLQGVVDKSADEFVKKAAQTFFKFDNRTKGKPRKMPETLEQCISYLEQAFPVPYDARYAKDLKVKGNVLDKMRPSNHHLLSLSHSPDIIGLIFSIIDQFDNMASFIDNGRIIRAEPKKTSGAIPYLQGTDTISKLFCGFVNWLGHLISDLVGSSSTRTNGKTNRGSGIQMPFYELFLLCDFGNIDGNTIAEIAIKAFEQGYDARFAMTMAIPNILNDVFIRFIWALKSHFYAKREWKQCIPNDTHADLRVMILVGTCSMCILDGTDAIIRSGGNPVVFVCRLNLIAWVKLAMLAVKELIIRYNYTYEPFRILEEYVKDYLKELEKIDLDSYKTEIQKYEDFCNLLDTVDNEEELNCVLKKIVIDLPWKGNFDVFMNNPNNHLEFQ